MITKAIFALVFPFLLVILFSKVTYNHYVGIALTAALLFASYMKGYTETYFIVGLDIISLVAGALFMAKKEVEKERRLKNIIDVIPLDEKKIFLIAGAVLTILVSAAFCGFSADRISRSKMFHTERKVSLEGYEPRQRGYGCIGNKNQVRHEL